MRRDSERPLAPELRDFRPHQIAMLRAHPYGGRFVTLGQRGVPHDVRKHDGQKLAMVSWDIR